MFAGGCTLEAAEQVCANDDDGLDVLLLVAALVDKSLLVHDPAQGRYRMLETIRQFAWEKLGAAWEARLAAEQDNFRAALDWEGPTGDDGAKRLRLGGALREFWWSQAQSGEGRHWLERALGTSPDAPVGAGLLAGEQGDDAAALTFFRHSQALYEQLGDQRGVAEALIALGQVAMM